MSSVQGIWLRNDNSRHRAVGIEEKTLRTSAGDAIHSQDVPLIIHSGVETYQVPYLHISSRALTCTS